MGGAVSSGRDNNELIDNLMGGNYIRSRNVERVFRALDRAEYMTPESRDQAYKDLAWRNGPLHLSSPCIYSEVMEGLELRPGLSFLNIGSGTGYLSTLAGLILGSGGISHGVEYHSTVVEYANKKLGQFITNSPTLDEFDFCEPKFYIGNGLSLTPQIHPYDRVYCGAGCPDEYENYFKQLIKVGGVLVMPLRDTLLQVRRVGPEQWVSRNLLTVSFASLCVPGKDDVLNNVLLDEQSPPRLQVLARSCVRTAMRGGVLRREPELREPEPRRQPPASCPRRICIPIEPGGAVEGLNILHDLDSETGANEMNALLSLVIRMDQNRVAGAIRFDRVDSTDSETDSDDSSESSSSSYSPYTDSAASCADVSDQGVDTLSEDKSRSSFDGSNTKKAGSEKSAPKSDPTSSDEGSAADKSDRKASRSNADRKSKDKNKRSSDRPGPDDSKGRSRRKSGRADDRKTRERGRGTEASGSDVGKNSKDSRRRKSDRTDESKGSKDKNRRRGPHDDKSNRPDRPRRPVPTGGLLAFEFQAKEKTSQPTTSTSGTGSAATTETSTSPSESGQGGRNENDRTRKSSPCACARRASEIVPAEVEFCFRGAKYGGLLPASGSTDLDMDMDLDWEEAARAAGAFDSSDTPDVEPGPPRAAAAASAESRPKRQKLDSGIGDAAASSPDRSTDGSRVTVESLMDGLPEHDVEAQLNLDAATIAMHRRMRKRSRAAMRAAAAAMPGGVAERAAREAGISPEMSPETSTEGSAEGGGEAEGEGAASSSAEEGAAGGAGGGAGARRRSARRSRARGRSYDARRTRLSILMKRAVKELPLPYQLKKYVNLGRCFEF